MATAISVPRLALEDSSPFSAAPPAVVALRPSLHPPAVAASPAVYAPPSSGGLLGRLCTPQQWRPHRSSLHPPSSGGLLGRLCIPPAVEASSAFTAPPPALMVDQRLCYPQAVVAFLLLVHPSTDG